MRSARIVVLTLIAALALGAVVTASASATEGELVNKSGNALVKNHFVGTFKEVQLEAVGGAKLACSSGSGAGTVKSKTEIEQTLTLKGCESGGVKCHTEAQVGGTIVIVIVYHVVANLYLLGDVFEIHTICGSTTITMNGSLLTPFVRGDLTAEYAFIDKQTKGIQEHTEYENEKHEKRKAILELETSTKSGKFEQAGLSGEEQVTLEETGEFT